MTTHHQVVPVVKQARAQSTVTLLLEATIDALEEHGESGVRVDDILDATGVSRSSLYHHFGDRDGLIDAARVVMFTRTADADIAALERALKHSSDATAFRAAIHRIVADSQSPARRPARLRRAYTIGASKARPSLATALATEQERLTERFTTFLQAGQVRGWIRDDLDPATAAVFIQAFTLGRVVSDISATPVDPEPWTDFARSVIDRMILTDDTGRSGGR